MRDRYDCPLTQIFLHTVSTFTGAWMPILTANPRRRAIVASSITDTYALTPDPTISTVGAIAAFGFTQPTLILLREDLGDLVIGPWWIFAGSNTAVTICEVVDMPEAR